MRTENFKEKLKNEGFFKVYFDKLLASIDDDVLKRFESLRTNEERLRFACEVVIPGKDLEIKWSSTGKDRDEAMKLKESGNKAFAKGNDEEALRLYTESLMKLPENVGSTSDLAVILANRSASLYHMTEYESARNDIEVALDLDYPKDLRYKIHDRKARCLLAEQKHNEAIDEFRKTLHALDESKLATDRKLKMQTDIQIMLGLMTKPKTKDGRVNALLPRKTVAAKKNPEPELSSKRHSVYTAACDKVDILRGKGVGRYAAAARDIDAGEVLLLEKPYSSVLLQEFATNHCLHCFKRTLAPYPCQNCSHVVFCSADCRKIAVTSYHKYECPVLATVYASGASVLVLMALRIVTQNSPRFFLDLKTALSDEEKEFKEYKSSDYVTLYHLVRHENLRKREDLFERTVMAWFLIQCLRKANYFTDSGGGTPTDEELFIGSLILRHLQILQFNGHEIFEVELKKGQKLEQAESIFIGGGIFTTLSLFNHSCDPGTVRYFRERQVVVRSIKPIKKGEVIAENYGPIFTRMRRDKRRAELKSQYWFECACIPCTENWPTFEEMDGSILRFRCDSRKGDGGRSTDCNNVIPVPESTEEFMVKCVACGQHTNILKGLKILQDTDAMYKQASRDAEAGNYQSALGIYLEILSMLDSVMVPPFKGYHLCQHAIRTCMLCLGSTFVRN